MGGPIPDFGQYQDWDNPLGMFIENLLQNIKDVTGIDLFWLLDWSWTTNTMMELIRQANDLMAWLQNPIQRPPNLLARPGFSSPSAIAEAPDWSWDAVVSLGTVTGPDGRPKTDPQGSARTTADGLQHSMLSKSISGSAITPGQILTCQMYALVEAGFTASDDQAIRLELVPSLLGALQDAVVLAHCGVPVDASTDWIAAPVGSKAVFFDVDYEVPKTDTPDTLELRVVVGESAGGNVPVRFDGGRVAAAGGFLVVLSDLFDAGRQYLTDLWAAIEAWLADMSAWAAFTTAADDAWAIFVKKVKRALRHADADSYVPPSTSGIISDALKNNPWFGWLFSMVDDWLEPVLNIGKASADFGDAIWQAVSTFVGDVSAPNAWQTMVSTITTAWDLFIRRVFVSWGATEAEAETKAQAMPNPASATEAAIKNNPVIGWVFDLDGLVDALTDVAKAAWDSLFGTTNYAGTFTDAWNALMSKLGWAGAPTKTIGEVGSAAATKLLAGIWQPLGDYLTELPLWLDGLNAAFTDFFKAAWDYILGGNRYDDTTRAAWSKPAGAILETAWKNLWAKITGTAASTAPTPGSAGAQGLWNGISSNFIQSALSGWTDSAIHAITDPISNFFDQVRKYINQMIEGLHLGYFDDSWAWVPSLTTPTTEIPGSGDAVMTPGRNDDDAPGISSQADASIPAAPTGLVAVPWWDLTVSNFPAGTITYAIAAVKGGVEGPATKVTAFAGTLIPPNTNGRVDLAWGAVSGATYRVYRKVDSTYAPALDWRLIASPSTAGTLATPYQDKTARTGGTVAHPKSDAELAAQIVTAVKSTATTAQSTATTAQSTATAAQTTASNAASTASAAQTTANTASGTASAAQSAAADAQTAATDASDAAAVAVNKFNAVPEKNIVVANVDPQIVPENWGVGLRPLPGTSVVSGTLVFESTNGAMGTQNPKSGGAVVSNAVQLKIGHSGDRSDRLKCVLLFLSWTGDRSDLVPAVVTSSSTVSFNLVASRARGNLRAGTGISGGCAVFMAADVDTYSGYSGQPIVYVGINRGDAVNGDCYTLDAWMVALDGSLSGELDVVSGDTPITSIDAADDSVALVCNSVFQTRRSSGDNAFSDLTVSAVAPGMDANHIMSNLTRTTFKSVRTSTIVLTKNIDEAETLSIATTPTVDNGRDEPPSIQGLGIGIVVKSLPVPATDTIGSYAEVSAVAAGAFTQTVGSYNPFTQFVETLRYSPDITVDAPTASFTVSYVGTYQVAVDLLCNETHDMNLGIAVNGTIVAARRCSGYSMDISTLVYAKQGDVISLKVKNNASGNITLDTLSRMTVSLVNRSYL